MSTRLSSNDFTKPNFYFPPLERTRSQVPAWLLTIPGVTYLIDRLGVTEFRRRMFHMSPGLLLVGLPFTPHHGLWGIVLFGLIVFPVIFISCAIVLKPLLTRCDERDWMAAVAGYTMPVIIPLLIFPNHTEFGLMTLQILAIGDGTATLGGIVFGGRHLPWNSRKTYAGLLCFAICGTLAATYCYWGEAAEMPIGKTFLICGVAALIAAIVESLPIRSNDNFRVGMTALFTGIAMTELVS